MPLNQPLVVKKKTTRYLGLGAYRQYRGTIWKHILAPSVSTLLGLSMDPITWGVRRERQLAEEGRAAAWDRVWMMRDSEGAKVF
jgi:hypothetical protein